MKKQKAFTLIELLVVIIIFGVLLSAVSMGLAPQYSRKINLQVERLVELFTFADEIAHLKRMDLRFNVDLPKEGEPYQGYTFLFYSSSEQDEGNYPWLPLGSGRITSLRGSSFTINIYAMKLVSASQNVPDQEIEREEENTDATLAKVPALHIDFLGQGDNTPFTLYINFSPDAKAPRWRAIKSNGLGSYKVIYHPEKIPL